MFSGSLVALITPFTSDRVDIDALIRLIETQIDAGTNGLVCLGTTGETPTLTSKEKEEIVKTCLKTVQKRIPVIVGTGTNCTRTTKENTRSAQELGADGALVITPYYNRPGEEGCYRHFQALEDLHFPTILYHHPPRTGVELSATSLARISQLPHIVGIKEGPSNLSLIRELKTLSDIPIFSGDDHHNLSVLKEGGAGVISSAANVIPKEMGRLCFLAKSGNWNDAKELSDEIKPLVSALFKEVNPQGIKYALSVLKRCRASLRLPLIEPNAVTKDAIRSALENVLQFDPRETCPS